jgi:hypothetical protein
VDIMKKTTESQNNHMYWKIVMSIIPPGEIAPNWTINNRIPLKVNKIRDKGFIFNFTKLLPPKIFVYHGSMIHYSSEGIYPFVSILEHVF